MIFSDYLSSYFELSSLELRDTKVFEPQVRAQFGIETRFSGNLEEVGPSGVRLNPESQILLV